MNSELQHRVAELDSRLVQLAKPIKVLKYLNWPDSVEESFLKDWRAGRPSLPQVEIQTPNWGKQISALKDLVSDCEGDEPVLQYLRRTAWSYAEAGRMLMSAGTPSFTDHSIHLYGRPDDEYVTQSISGIDAARFLLEKTDHLLQGASVAPIESTVSAVQFAEKMQLAISTYFIDDHVSVEVDSDLSSKAIAGTTRLRIRGSAVFSELDFDQLYHHEALVHMATAINGKRQFNLKSLGLGAPRTTRTQEGIAVFAELVTRSIDISRLRRLALRIESLKHALDGADFIDCFKLFLEAGQDEREAYKSAQRIFRGGDVRGGIVFTKDSAYLKGLMETHVLMNVAIRDNEPEIIERLFAGRMAASDAITLAPCFESGFIKSPRYVPPWARDVRRLAATLAYSSFMMNVNLQPVTLQGFVAAAKRSEID